MAYERKQWSIDNLCTALTEHAEKIGLVWGWGDDPKEPVHSAVLYIDLPQGQVSFHTYPGAMGPKYEKPLDGVHGASETRVCRYVAQILSGEPPPEPETARAPRSDPSPPAEQIALFAA
jgi:hypothetical protein